jgi:hypothetical protein
MASLESKQKKLLLALLDHQISRPGHRLDAEIFGKTLL